MPLRTSHSEELPTLNLTSMIDVVFLLLIFFMVATKFAEQQQQIGISLAGVGGLQPMVAAPDRIPIGVASDGSVTIDSATVTLDELTTRLVSKRVQYPSLSVSVNADGTVAMQKVMEALAAAKRAGINDISLGARASTRQQMR